ncbi:O-antigen ligase family protein [Nocardioides sp. SYSU DS0651]|uniref:O-antigen ligase family protein n=1 Tax=Nocardioides sp. SYSU DS0651 TaxID=3415955 RepID=UPI003F4B48B8
MPLTARAQARPARSRAAQVLPLTIGLAVVLLPFGDVAVPALGLRLSYVATAVPASIAVLLVVRDEVRLPASIVLLGSGLGLAAAVVSTAGGVDPDRSIPLLVLSVVTLGYALAIAVAGQHGRGQRDLAELLVAVGGVVAAMALVSAGSLRAAEAGNVVDGRLTGPFAQPNELGVFCAALLPLGVACAVTAASRRRGVLLAGAVGCLAAACVLSMSRGAWIGALVALVALAVCEPRTRRALATAAAAVAATCLAALAVPPDAAVLGVLGQRIRSLGDPTGNQYDDRPLTWAEAWRQATDHPWFGVGPGGFNSAAGDSVSTVSADPADHPHNLLLTVLADRGVVGLALGVLVVAGCVVAVRRQLLAGPPAAGRDGARTRNVAVVAALTAVAVHGSFDMPLRNPIVAALVWTLLGMAAVVETSGPDDDDPTTVGDPQHGAAALHRNRTSPW